MIRRLIASVMLLAGVLCASAEEPAPIYGQRSTLFADLAVDSTSVVFLGNSLTHGCEWHELLKMPNALNRGISGDTCEDIDKRLAPVLAGKPAKIFLMAGTNDVSHDLSADTIASMIMALVDRIRTESPTTLLYLQSLLPCNNSFGRYKRMIDKEQTIRDVNALIEPMAAERGVPFINLHPLFCDEQGNLRADFTNDGLHLLGPAYQIWKQALLPYLE